MKQLPTAAQAPDTPAPPGTRRRIFEDEGFVERFNIAVDTLAAVPFARRLVAHFVAAVEGLEAALRTDEADCAHRAAVQRYAAGDLDGGAGFFPQGELFVLAESLWKSADYDRLHSEAVAAALATSAGNALLPRLDELKAVRREIIERAVAIAQGGDSGAWEPPPNAVKRKTTRHGSRKSDPATLACALEAWHKIGTDNEHLTPATAKDLLSRDLLGKLGWTKDRLSRAFGRLFAGGGSKAYKAACSTSPDAGFLGTLKDETLAVEAPFER